MRSHLRTQTGSVTAEFAIALPAVMMVAGVLLGGMGLGVERVKLAYAAGTLARASARAEDTTVLATQLGVSVGYTHLEDFVCAHAKQEWQVIEIEEVSCARKLGL